MNKNIIILSKKDPDVTMKTIDANDIEELRKWKNKHKDSFFYKNIISIEEQIEWYEKYCNRQNDFMFVIFFKENRVGCIGFRMIHEVVDIYNVILGESQYSSQGIMKRALDILLNYIMQYYNYDITAKVLKSNPAITWYQKNGFEIVTTYNDYYLIKFNNLILPSTTEIIIKDGCTL